MKILRVEINHLPFPELSPNSRVHWAVKARAAKVAREEVGWLAKAQWHDQEPIMKAKIEYRFFYKNNRKRDWDNLLASCKPFQDGLIDAGVIFCDDAEHLQTGLNSMTADVKDRALITVSEIE